MTFCFDLLGFPFSLYYTVNKKQMAIVTSLFRKIVHVEERGEGGGRDKWGRKKRKNLKKKGGGRLKKGHYSIVGVDKWLSVFKH